MIALTSSLADASAQVMVPAQARLYSKICLLTVNWYHQLQIAL